MQKIIINLGLLIGLSLFSRSHPESVDFKRNTSKKSILEILRFQILRY
jgi:hypothetical protein